MKKFILWLGILVLGLFAVGVTYEQWARYRVNDAHRPAGVVIRMPWGETHINCSGVRDATKLTIILQSGLDLFGSLSWAPIQQDIARSFRVCSYDRPGILWSEPINSPRDAVSIADELTALLKTVGERPPFLLVGHSLGGLMSQVHAARYPEEVTGLVLIDSSHHEQAQRLPPEAVAAEMSEPPPDWLVATAANVGLLRLLDPFPSTPIPDSVAPARQFMSTSAGGLIAEVRAIPTITTQAGEERVLKTLPIVVMTRGREPDGLRKFLSDDIIAEAAEVWLELQAELTQLSERSEQHVVEDAGHYIHHDQPKVVVDTILEFATTLNGG